ncbi:LPXTG cell wall anchor domain-containing protein, partial [uncultured Parvimonas sp.]|uniref:LPXTG cell wall anchor domain-containing protein n=1 Tax=uncultured Parvimonas sp. TaxID=747372 RepID=UPI002596F3B7
KLADSGKKVTLTKGNLTAQTNALTVNEKETPLPSPKPTDPNGGKPAETKKYYTVTFVSADETKGTVAKENTFHVLKTENKTLADITAPEVTAKAGYEFDKWELALDKNTVINKDMTVKAYFKQKIAPTPKKPPVVGPVDPQDPNGEKPADTSKYYTVTFKADPAKGTIDAKNTFYVLKNSGKTLADLANDAPKVTAKAGFKFTGWEPALDANTTINKDMTVNAKFEKVTPTPTDPPVDPQDPPVDPKDPPVDPKDPPVVGPEDPTQPGGKSQVANNKVLPKTASSMNIELYTIFMILSGALLVVAFKRKKESQ